MKPSRRAVQTTIRIAEAMGGHLHASYIGYPAKFASINSDISNTTVSRWWFRSSASPLVLCDTWLSILLFNLKMKLWDTLHGDTRTHRLHRVVYVRSLLKWLLYFRFLYMVRTLLIASETVNSVLYFKSWYDYAWRTRLFAKGLFCRNTNDLAWPSLSILTTEHVLKFKATHQGKSKGRGRSCCVHSLSPSYCLFSRIQYV